MLVFAHVSDLHFSEVLANASPGTTTHQDPHRLALCLALPSALNDARVLTGMAQHEPINVVASGDLTLCGGSEEFAIAQVFLRSNAIANRTRPVAAFGLGVEAKRLAVVPGNHDHWGGQRGSWNFAKGLPAFTPSVQGQHFRPTPWKKLWTAPDQSISLELFGVDSNSGMAGTRFNYSQGGRIAASELTQLEKWLQTPKAASTVRAFVCHHSLGYKGGLFGAAHLESGSQKELVRLAGAYDVSAILTGHTHDFVWMPHRTRNRNGLGSELWELRSASTVASGQGMNGFLLHRIASDGRGGWEWSGWDYRWSSKRFERKSKVPSFSFP